MRLTFAGQTPSVASSGAWVHAPLACPPSGPSAATIDCYTAEVRVRPGETSSSAFARVRARLFAYDIFQSTLVRFAICPEGRIQEGATIIQRFQLGLVALEAAVRVTDVWDDQEGLDQDAGFRYVTLQEHPECGVASFRVQHDQEGRVTVTLEARSRPGLLVTRLARPIARVIQRLGTNAALLRLARG